MTDREIVTANNTAAENAAQYRGCNFEGSPLERVIAEENEKRARHLRKIARLSGEAR